MLIGILSMFMIAASYFITQVIYAKVLGIEFYMSMHSLMILAVMAISADNKYITYDSWEQSGKILEFQGNLHMRMAFSWKRST